jgi:hypothetical protein
VASDLLGQCHSQATRSLQGITLTTTEVTSSQARACSGPRPALAGPLTVTSSLCHSLAGPGKPLPAMPTAQGLGHSDDSSSIQGLRATPPLHGAGLLRPGPRSKRAGMNSIQQHANPGRSHWRRLLDRLWLAKLSRFAVSRLKSGAGLGARDRFKFGWAGPGAPAP